MPFGRMTITLYDVKLILGKLVYSTPYTEYTRKQLLVIINSDFDVRYTGSSNDYFQQGGIGQKDVIHACEDVGSHLKDRMRAACYVLSIIGNYFLSKKSRMSIVSYKL